MTDIDKMNVFRLMKEYEEEKIFIRVEDGHARFIGFEEIKKEL